MRSHKETETEQSQDLTTHFSEHYKAQNKI